MKYSYYQRLKNMCDAKNSYLCIGLDFDLDKMKIEIRTKLDKIEKLGNLEWDDDCEFCMSNPFTLDAMETKKKLEVDKDILKKHLEEFDSINETIKTLYHTRERKADLDDNINRVLLGTKFS